MIRKLTGAAFAAALLALAALPASRPVLSDTLTWADAQFATLTSAVASNLAAITTANTRTAGVIGGDGTVALPAFTFTGENSTGVFRPGAGMLAVTTSGTERMRFGPSYMSVPTGTRWGINASTDTITANSLTVPNYGIAVGGSIGGGAGLHLSGYYAIGFYRGGGEVWRMSPDFLPSVDNVFNIGSASQRVKSLFGIGINLTGATAPTSSSDASGVVGDLRMVGNTLYWKTASGWVKTVGATF